MSFPHNFDEDEFKKSRSAEMHCAAHGFNNSWNKLTDQYQLPWGYMIFRFPKDIFCIIEHLENPKRIISLFFDHRMQHIKTIEDFKVVEKYQNINTLIKILGKPTHWKILDLEIPKYWKNV